MSTESIVPPTPPPARPFGPLWRIAAAVAIVTTLALIVALWPFLRALGAALTPLSGAFAILLVIAAFGLVIGGLAIVAAAAFRRFGVARQAHVLTLPGDLPVRIKDVKKIGVTEAHWAMEQFYGIGRAEAERPMPNLSSFHQVLKIDGPPPPPQIEDVTPPQLPDPLAGLGDAITRGWSSPDRWLVGTSNGVPQQIVLKHTGFIAISGVQGTGKTNGAAYLAAQCAAHNGTLYIADPHYGDDESLSSRIKPFSGAVASFAMTPDEINAMIAKVDSIYMYRRDHPGTYPPLLLIIDEFMELMIRKQLSSTAIESLLALSGVGRKKHIFCVPIAQNWNLRVLGSLGVSVRQAVTHALVFKSSKETAELLLPTSYAQRALTLKPGQTLYFANDEPAVTDVPWLSSDDMQLAARGRTPTSYTPAPGAIASGPPIPPAAPLPITERVSPAHLRAAPPTVPMAPPTVPEQIADLLRGRNGWMTASEIAAALAVDLPTVRTELSSMSGTGQLRKRQPTGRTTKEKFEYAVQPVQPNQPAQPTITPTA